MWSYSECLVLVAVLDAGSVCVGVVEGGIGGVVGVGGGVEGGARGAEGR